ncbi:MAG: quinone oxidoreductase [Lewinellaceae bacterium]|nr:quinone oxidoreductase [Lewinellaceae bacterium]
MPYAIRIHEPGGPEALQYEAIELPDPGPGEALIRHTAIGLNFVDTYFRSGLYAWPHQGPLIVGAEGAGEVLKTGAGVEGLAAGDRVAYTLPTGAYAQQRIVPAHRLVKIPAGVSDEVAAASMVKGLTAHYLLHRTFRVQPGQAILFHAAAGGVGSIAGQWAAALGATVIGTAGSDEKAALAKANGYHHVINYRTEDFVERVKEITGGRGVDVVYDSVGQDTYPGSLDCLRRLGMWVCFGQSSGVIRNFELSHLAQKGSLFATRPTLYSYIATREELEEGAGALFGAIEDGTVQVPVNQRFSLKEAAEAHRQLEGRQTTGSSVLIP